MHALWIIAMDNRTFVRYAFTWIVIVGAVSSAFGQARDQSRLAVDVINLKSHKQIRGFVLSAKATEEVRVAVSREWLEKEAADTFLKDQEAAMQEDLKAKLHLRDRLKISSTNRLRSTILLMSSMELSFFSFARN